LAYNNMNEVESLRIDQKCAIVSGPNLRSFTPKPNPA